MYVQIRKCHDFGHMVRAGRMHKTVNRMKRGSRRNEKKGRSRKSLIVGDAGMVLTESSRIDNMYMYTRRWRRTTDDVHRWAVTRGDRCIAWPFARLVILLTSVKSKDRTQHIGNIAIFSHDGPTEE